MHGKVVKLRALSDSRRAAADPGPVHGAGLLLPADAPALQYTRMRSRRRFLQSLAAGGVILQSRLRAADAGPVADGELSVMTYNLRYASATGAHAWPARRPAMAALLREASPDVFGTQEGLYGQLRDLAADLPAYEWIGTGRDGGSRGEFMAVYYRRDRLEPLEYDHFWLSDTPNVVGSSTWGNTNRRMVTWVRFLDRVTRREFYFWNTHLDHALQPAREKGARLIRERLKTLKAGVPLLLVGDFNAEARENPVYDQLVGDDGLVDTWYAARERREENANSFNGFEPLRREGKRIDWILVSQGARVRSAAILTQKPKDVWPSDHCPVVARVGWD